MRVLAEIPAPVGADDGPGTLRRRDLEAFRSLLEELRGSRVVLVTGDRARKGALAIGMATAAAAAGTRAVLVECDLADPRLADSLGTALAPGLCEYLRGDAAADEILEAAVLAGPGSATAREPLVCIVAGRPASDGSTLLGSERFRQAIESLRAAYELVVLEGPSLEEEGALTPVAAAADTRLACLGGDDPRPQSAVELTGLVLQR